MSFNPKISPEIANDHRTWPELVEAYLTRLEDRYREALAIEYAMSFHEKFWGVPVGPTLSMVHPPEKRSILELLR